MFDSFLQLPALQISELLNFNCNFPGFAFFSVYQLLKICAILLKEYICQEIVEE